ncbi:fasciclin domain-containing protein [Methanoregula sp.]
MTPPDTIAGTLAANGRVLFGGAPVIIPDIACTNGVIHGIGRGIIPR